MAADGLVHRAEQAAARLVRHLVELRAAALPQPVLPGAVLPRAVRVPLAREGPAPRRRPMGASGKWAGWTLPRPLDAATLPQARRPEIPGR